jgi:hypothetical protein
MRGLPAYRHAESEVGEPHHYKKSLEREPQSSITTSEQLQDERNGDNCAKNAASLLIPPGQDSSAGRMRSAPVERLTIKMHAASGEVEDAIEFSKSHTDHLIHVVIAIGHQAADCSG